MAGPSHYVRVDSALGANEKLLDVSDEMYLEVAGLYVLILGRCDIANTDGMLTIRAITGVRGVAPGRDDLLDELVRVDLVTRNGHTITVPDYLEWQRSADEKISASERGRRAARTKHRKVQSESQCKSHSETQCKSQSETHSESQCVGHAETHAEQREQREQAKRESVDARATFDELWNAYPVHKYRDQALAAFEAFDGDPADLIAAAAAVGRDSGQTLRYFIEDGTWRDHLPKRKRRKCDVCGGAGVVIDGDVARPCPECGAS